MKIKSEQEEAIEKINKFTGFQLPNKFKALGLVMFIIAILLIIVFAYYFENSRFYGLLNRISQSILVLGLLIISISKEKIEDELIAKIRMQSYNYAVVGTVVTYLIYPLTDALYFSSTYAPKMEGSKDVAVLSLMLTIQILVFRRLKRAYNEE
jgi:L-asparagine transporter-like permease